MDDSDNASGDEALADLGALTLELTRYLRAHARFLASDHEDLVQQTLIDLLAPAGPAEKGQVRLHSRPVAFAILRRRIADRYRDVVRRATLENSVVDGGAPRELDLSNSVSYEMLLKEAMAMISAMDARDRDLLLDRALPGTRLKPWSDAERQQLSRLRRRLRDQLGKKFNIDPNDILKD